MENIRKRSEREKEETAKYAVTRFARDIVNVGDNFQRAIDAVPPGAAEQDAALKSFLEGVTMTERELLNVLERYGIKRVQPVGEPFNPHLHQAVMEIQRSDVPAGTVVQVFQAGFTIEDRVLRPAMVAVSKGGPKPAPAPDGTAGPATPPPANENPHPASETPPVIPFLSGADTTRPPRHSARAPARAPAAAPPCRWHCAGSRRARRSSRGRL